MGAISKAFDRVAAGRRGAFIPFITAGDPDLPTTVRLVLELERAGADIIELGIPFSDPLADGPVIQRASERALRHGYALADFLEAVSKIRASSGIPIILFSYYNPVFCFGVERFAGEARTAGVDGVLITDITPEESSEYRDAAARNSLDTIYLVAPTSSARRIARICECCSGFVYLVSRTGVTGARENLSDTVGPTLDNVRRLTRLPVAVGFGISRPEHVRAVWKVAEGAVVGSAIVGQVEASLEAPDLVAEVASFCRWLIEEASHS